jgi:hypothetical protein
MPCRVRLDHFHGLDVVVAVVDVDVARDGFLHNFDAFHVVGLVGYGRGDGGVSMVVSVVLVGLKEGGKRERGSGWGEVVEA